MMVDQAFLEERRAPEPPRDPADCRSEFERDRARILHSAAFRRLQGKTQVHGVGERDFYRTRLTHSLECAQIGRALALRLWAPPYVELVEAACLAHDLGHPPFGHAGESVLARHVAFEGNAQTFRLLGRLEAKVPGSGLNLCRATLLSVVKYPYRELPGNAKFIYADDEPLAAWALEGAPAGLEDRPDGEPPRALSAELMEWADDVAYSTHDLEDGLVGGFIDREVLADPGLRQRVLERACARVPCEPGEVAALLDELGAEMGDDGPDDVRLKALVNRYVHRLVIEVGTAPGADPGHPLFARRLEVPPPVRRLCEILKALVWIAVIQSERVLRGREVRCRAIDELFGALREDARTGALGLWPAARRRAVAALPAAGLDRAVADYLAGMTDAFALRVHGELMRRRGETPGAPRA